MKHLNSTLGVHQILQFNFLMYISTLLTDFFFSVIFWFALLLTWVLDIHMAYVFFVLLSIVSCVLDAGHRSFVLLLRLSLPFPKFT